MDHSPRIARVDKIDVFAPQWAVLEILPPFWIEVRKSFCPPQTRCSMVRRGWLDVRDRGEYFLARLTPAGRALRDRLIRRWAIRRDRGTSVGRKKRET